MSQTPRSMHTPGGAATAASPTPSAVGSSAGAASGVASEGHASPARVSRGGSVPAAVPGSVPSLASPTLSAASGSHRSAAAAADVAGAPATLAAATPVSTAPSPPSPTPSAVVSAGAHPPSPSASVSAAAAACATPRSPPSALGALEPKPSMSGRTSQTSLPGAAEAPACPVPAPAAGASPTPRTPSVYAAGAAGGIPRSPAPSVCGSGTRAGDNLNLRSPRLSAAGPGLGTGPVAPTSPSPSPASPVVVSTGPTATGVPTTKAEREPTEADLLELEAAIRGALRKRQTVQEGPKALLLRLFRSVDDGSGDVSPEELIAVCAALDVKVSMREAHALFRRIGYSPKAEMPYDRFAARMLTPPARQLAEDVPVRKDSFKPGKDNAHQGKVLYFPCRKPVYTPVDFDPSQVERSSQEPDARLRLEFVYGYQGMDNTHQNLFYAHEERIVYHSAGVGIVYERPPAHRQAFFLGHTNDITALALCAAGVEFRGVTYAPRTLVATGQLTSEAPEGGKEGATLVKVPPYVCIWDSSARAEEGEDGQEGAGAGSQARAGGAASQQDARGAHGVGRQAQPALQQAPGPSQQGQQQQGQQQQGESGSGEGGASGSGGGASHAAPPALPPLKPKEVVRLRFDNTSRGLCALAFSPSGTWLVAVTMDNAHSVYVCDWRAGHVCMKALQPGQKLAIDVKGPARGQKESMAEAAAAPAHECLPIGTGKNGDPPQVYGIEWNPYDASEPGSFVQFGKKHIKLWTCSASAGGADRQYTWSGRSLTFGQLLQQHITAAQWLPAGSGAKPTAYGPGSECGIVAGTEEGQIYIFKGSAAVRSFDAHLSGPKYIRGDGHPGYSGVRGLRMIQDGKILLSGGADGAVKRWDVMGGSLREVGVVTQLYSPYGPSDPGGAPAVRSLDYSPVLGTVLAGTNTCDIMEVSASGQQMPLMDAHSGDIYSVAFHPAKPNVFATVADSGHIHVYDADTRCMIQCAGVGWTPRAVAFSEGPLGRSGGHHLAVGSIQGKIKILDEDQGLRPLHECKGDRTKQSVTDIKYSPNNRYMAVAGCDTYIDIYRTSTTEQLSVRGAKCYQLVSRCGGHSATVRGVDWSVDSSLLMTNSNDYELLFWEVSGKQVTTPLLDVAWRTYTCMLGFTVMGIWPPGAANGLNINSLQRSHNARWLVTSDDQGMVKLFAYPCVAQHAPHRTYRGHSSHVMCVRFSGDDRRVVSVGGHDWAIFQFRVEEILPPPPPPPPPEVVWGPLDDSGRNFGLTTRPGTGDVTAIVTPGVDQAAQQRQLRKLWTQQEQQGQ